MIETTSIDKRSFFYGQKTITYSLSLTDRRSLEIAVHPDSTVVVKAPLDSDISLIEKKLHKRARWILKQLNYFRQFNPKTPVRQYINGETHLYLGRQYRLKIFQGQENSVKLIKGFFQVACRKEHNSEIIKKLMNNWYLQKANIQFNESLARCWPKFNAFAFTQPSISIRRMKKRWGSLSNKGTVILNTDLIKAPKECIDYVVSHELCHLKYHDHSPEFHMLLDSVIPGWKKIKHKLELSMV
ncbi:MAG: M48 family metallopeptidase [Deltaproteobacteria bacterium]|nr:M48 family metallopeptidase [Deltaproteobacteria bacterium]